MVGRRPRTRMAEVAIDDPTEQSGLDREPDDREQSPEEVVWPEITGRDSNAERLTFTIYNAMLPLAYQRQQSAFRLGGGSTRGQNPHSF